jgi:hypothetical protein
VKILYAKAFSKDLESIEHHPTVKKRLQDLIEKLKTTESLEELAGVKKVEGYASYWRLPAWCQTFRRKARTDSLPTSQRHLQAVPLAGARLPAFTLRTQISPVVLIS